MKTWRELLSIAIIILISAVFFWPVWLKGRLPIPADALVGLYHPFRDYFSDKFPNGVPFKNPILTDPVLQQYPWKWLAINQLGSILKGYSFKDTPLLANPYSFAGFAASSIENIQAGVFYPLNILFFLINNFPVAWTVFIFLQPVMASVFMFWWLKNREFSDLAGIFGGVVWAFSSFNLVWLEWGNVGQAGLYLPLALLAVDKLQVTSYKLQVRWHLALQFSLAASLLAGHWQVTLYLLSAVCLYSALNKKFSLFLAHCFLFLVLTSFQWLPALKFMAASNRTTEQENVLSREGFFIIPKHLVQLVAPDFFGNPATGNYRGEWNYSEQVIYVGIIPLILAILAIVNPINQSKGGLQRFGLVLILIGLVFGVRNPIAEIPYKLDIPVWSDLQPTRLSYLITFGLSVLAAGGMEILMVSFNKSLKNMAVITGGLGGIFLTLLILSSKLDAVERVVSQRNLIWPAVIYVSSAAVFIFFYLVKKPGLFVACCLLLVACVDLFRFGWKFTPFSPPEFLYPVTPAIKFLQENMESEDKYMSLDRRILPPNANIIYKLESIEGYDPIYSRVYASLITEMETGEIQEMPANFGRIVRPGNFRSPVAKELGVKYVLGLNEIQDERLIKVFQEGETRIYQLSRGE